jgi:chemotaxis signal transduction protein
MIDYSIGFTVSEVEEILAVQKAELKKTLTAYANDGSSYSKRRIDEIHTIIGACQKALQKLDPQKYPTAVRISSSFVDSKLEL